MLYFEKHNLQVLGDNKMHHLSYPLSLVVDACIPQPSGYVHYFSFEDTFSSVRIGATQGDTVTLDMLQDVSTLYPDVRITLLVNNAFSEHAGSRRRRTGMIG